MKKTILESGLTVLTEKFTRIPSFALSYTIKSGSCRETTRDNGLHHLIEHMLFKGSLKYSQKKIADMSDRLGGRLNAFTSREITQCYIKSIDEKLPQSFDLLTDIVFNSEFDNKEYQKEVEVIKQEIKESDDNPDSMTFELFYKDVFGDTGVGLPIAGTMESVASLSRDYVFDKYREIYNLSDVILSTAGNIDHDEIVSLAEQAFPPIRRTSGLIDRTKGPTLHHGLFLHRNKSLKQVYSVIGFKSIPVVSPDRFKYILLNDLMGAGMSSRLFQTIREDHGLAYTVSSFIDSYRDFGIHMIYAVTEPSKTGKYLDAVKEEIELLCKKGIDSDELEKSRDHIKSSLILSLDNNVSKMRFNINGEIYFNHTRPLKDIIDEINKVSVGDINDILSVYPRLDNAAVLLYGDIKKRDLEGFDFHEKV